MRVSVRFGGTPALLPVRRAAATGPPTAPDATIRGVDVQPVGRVRSPRTEPLDDDWDAITATIELDRARFAPDALRGLEDFSHLEVVYLFHRVDAATVQTAARRPRGNPDWPEVGIFAQRAKARPNRLGVSVCRLLAVEELSIRVQALDAIDGTPVLDLKPYLREFAPRGEVRQPAWATELMAGYWQDPGSVDGLDSVRP